MAKTTVNGPKTEPVWAFCKEAVPGDVKWNFAAFFVLDQQGQVLGRFGSRELDKADRVLADVLA